MGEREAVAGRVSVVVPVYNRLNLLGQTLESVQRQSCDDLEILVVDDSSQEDAEGYVRGFAAQDRRVTYLLHSPNGGIAAAKRYGASHATGEFLQFLDSDDLMHRDKVAVQVAALRADPTLDITVCQTSIFTLKPGDGPKLWNTFTGESPIDKMCQGEIPWQDGAPVYRAASYWRFGGHQAHLRRAEDRELAMRLLTLGCRYRLMPHLLLFYRLSGINQESAARWGDPVVSMADLYLMGLENLERNGELTDSRRAAIAACLFRLASRLWKAGKTEDAAKVLEEVGRCGIPSQDSAGCLDLAAALRSGGQVGEASFEMLKARGYDASGRRAWWNAHRVFEEPLEPPPKQRRYGSAPPASPGAGQGGLQ
ncbi:MAG: glycosyltransferase family 2 protein [Armatimonadetes bacterium]|nr:glycosyltransferase family 2 protein [Armatimonadota bacterium]